jgi:DNA-binding MarR family transcriptional regulator
MTEPKITPAQRRALEAIRDGKVTSWMLKYGIVIGVDKGIGSQTVRRLLSMGLAKAEGIRHEIQVILTDAGRMALRQAEEQQ